MKAVSDVILTACVTVFALSGCGLLPAGLWFMSETSEEPATVYFRALKAMKGGWPELRSAQTLRGFTRLLLLSWLTAFGTLIVRAFVEAAG